MSKLYAVSKIRFWEEALKLVIEDAEGNTDIESIPMRGRNSIGFIEVYDDLEVLLEENPDADYHVMELIHHYGTLRLNT